MFDPFTAVVGGDDGADVGQADAIEDELVAYDDLVKLGSRPVDSIVVDWWSIIPLRDVELVDLVEGVILPVLPCVVALSSTISSSVSSPPLEVGKAVS